MPRLSSAKNEKEIGTIGQIARNARALSWILLQTKNWI